jgi:hypothetical protein
MPQTRRAGWCDVNDPTADLSEIQNNSGLPKDSLAPLWQGATYTRPTAGEGAMFNIGRRELIVLLGGALACPLAARAQARRSTGSVCLLARCRLLR